MKALFNLKEVSEQVRMKIPTLRSWIYTDKLPVIRMGRRIYVTAETLEILMTEGLDGIKQEE